MLAIIVLALTATASEICLKIGASETASHTTILPWLGLTGLESRWVWVGIVLTVLSFIAWVRAIRVIPLSLAYTCSNAAHIFMPLGCWLLLGESMSPRRWCGIGLVMVGLLVITKPFAQLSEKLESAL